jgi:prophage regulatory protein
MSIERSLALTGNALTDRIIGEPECREITNLSRTSRWRLMQRDQFPKKIKLSPNRTGWKLSSVITWLAEREAVR